MKVNNIQNRNIRYNSVKNTDKKAAQNTSPSFKGTLAVNFWDAVARGGFAASFTLQDMTGTNLPRTYQALQRNKEITGENNYKAAIEVAAREFITGPSMTFIPMAVLAFSKKKCGKANDVPLENIGAFSDQMKEILTKTKLDRTDLDCVQNYPEQYSKRMKNVFYERMFALALGEDIKGGDNISNNAKELAKMLEEYDNAPKRGFFKQLLDKDLIQKTGNTGIQTKNKKIEAKDQIFEKIVNKFSDARKTMTDDYSDLLSTDMGGILKKRNYVPSLIKDFSNFGCDIQDTMVKNTVKNGAVTNVGIKYDSFMDEFKTMRTGSKFLTNIIMVAAAALFMINIPKIYTIYKTNPETDAFRSKEGEVIRADK